MSPGQEAVAALYDTPEGTTVLVAIDAAGTVYVEDGISLRDARQAIDLAVDRAVDNIEAKATRRPFSVQQRFDILMRDGFRCRYCGRCAPDVVLVIDHIDPVAKGGSDDPANLTAACVDCNAGKAAKRLPDDDRLPERLPRVLQFDQELGDPPAVVLRQLDADFHSRFTLEGKQFECDRADRATVRDGRHDEIAVRGVLINPSGVPVDVQFVHAGALQ